MKGLGGGEETVRWNMTCTNYTSRADCHAESEPFEDTPRPTATPIPPISQPPSPPAPAPPQVPGSSHRKGGPRKQKRLGRNQYSAPRAAAHTSDTQPTAAQPNGSSGDDPTTNSTTESKNSPSSTNDTPAVTSVPAKSKPAKWGRAKNQRQAAAVLESDVSAKDRDKNNMTITDMKKRTGLMMDYIAKTQVDMAGDRTPLNPSNQAPLQNQSADFKELTSMEMMDVLTRHIMSWQKEYGGETPASVA